MTKICCRGVRANRQCDVDPENRLITTTPDTIRPMPQSAAASSFWLWNKHKRPAFAAPAAATMAFAERARRAGVEIQTDAPFDPEVDGERTTGVVLASSERIAAGQVLVAAGPGFRVMVDRARALGLSHGTGRRTGAGGRWGLLAGATGSIAMISWVQGVWREM